MDSAGRYRVDAPIGHGGMGEVYRARMSTTTGIDKLVALKVIRSDLAADPAFAELFVREAKVAIAMSAARTSYPGEALEWPAITGLDEGSSSDCGGGTGAQRARRTLGTVRS